MHFIKQPHWVYYEGHTIFFCAMCCQLLTTLSFTISLVLSPSTFFPPSPMLCGKEFFVSHLNFLFFSSAPRKKSNFSKCWSDNFFCKKHLSLLGSYMHRMCHPTLLVTRPCSLHMSNVATGNQFLRQVPHKNIPKPIKQSLLHFAKLMCFSLDPVCSM